jgi:hypothetical protein
MLQVTRGFTQSDGVLCSELQVTAPYAPSYSGVYSVEPKKHAPAIPIFEVVC